MNSLIEKVKLIKRLDKRSQYSFHPVARLQDVEYFEKKFELKLPEDYRSFVLNIANGIDDTKKETSPLIKTNFVDDLIQLDDESFNPSIEFPIVSRTKKLVNGFHYDQLTNGNVWLKSTKCGRGIILIVKGKAKGQIWGECLSRDSEVFPWYEEIPLENNFNRWINDELDNILTCLKATQEASRGNLLKKLRTFISKKDTSTEII